MNFDVSQVIQILIVMICVLLAAYVVGRRIWRSLASWLQQLKINEAQNATTFKSQKACSTCNQCSSCGDSNVVSVRKMVSSEK